MGGGSLQRAIASEGGRIALSERQRLAEVQRARMLAATMQVACERGAGNLTVAHVVQRAGVSRRTFYEMFGDSQDCILAAFERALARAAARVVPAYETPGRWQQKVRAGLAALLALFDEDPNLAQFLVVESLGAGRSVLERRADVLQRITAVVHAGSADSKAATTVTPLTAEGVIGAVLSVLHARLSELRERQALLALLNPLLSMIVLPYLGSAAARRELERPAPVFAQERPAQPRALRADPFKEAGMRLTYRTMRVLSVIAANPASSNRRIGTLAGAADQGQVSKLLARLQRLGLVVNQGTGHSKGEANAWVLTAKGRQVQQRIDAHTDASSTEPRIGGSLDEGDEPKGLHER